MSEFDGVTPEITTAEAGIVQPVRRRSGDPIDGQVFEPRLSGGQTVAEAQAQAQVFNPTPEEVEAALDQAERRVDTLQHNQKMSSRFGRLFTLLGMQFPGVAIELASKTAEMNGLIRRNALPEPWDYPDHVGNFNEAGLYTGAAFSFLNVLISKRKGETTESTIRQSAVGAFVISSLIQVVGERYLRIGGYNSTDMIDAYYGIGFSALVAAGGNAGYQRARRRSTKYLEKAQAIYDEFDETYGEYLVSDDEYVDQQTDPNALRSKKSNPKAAAAKKKKRAAQKKSRRQNRR